MKDTLSFKIFKLLKTNKINQKELAKRTGIKQSSLSRILSDKYKTKTETLQKIAKALNISVGELLDEPQKEKEKDKIEVLKEKLKLKEQENKILKKQITFLEDRVKFLENKVNKKK